MKEKLPYDTFIVKIRKIRHAVSVTGEEYVCIHCDNNVCTGIRESTKESFEINLRKLYQAYKECEVINTSTLKPYVDRVQSPSYTILIAAELI